MKHTKSVKGLMVSVLDPGGLAKSPTFPLYAIMGFDYVRVKVEWPTGQQLVISPEALEFGYRDDDRVDKSVVTQRLAVTNIKWEG